MVFHEVAAKKLILCCSYFRINIILIEGILLTLPIIELIGRKKTLAFEFLVSAIFFLMLLICTSRYVDFYSLFSVSLSVLFVGVLRSYLFGS